MKYYSILLYYFTIIFHYSTYVHSQGYRRCATEYPKSSAQMLSVGKVRVGYAQNLLTYSIFFFSCKKEC